MREIGRLVLVLGLICSLSGASLSYVRDKLAGRIERQNDLFIRGPALSRLFGRPADELLGNKVNLQADGRTYPVFFVRQDGRVTGLAVEAAGRGGYGGDVVVMVGVDLPGRRSTGMEVISHAETPGVGSRIGEEAFRRQWQGLDLARPAALRSEGGLVDAVTGATFSSRAVIDGTNQIFDLVGRHEQEILDAAAGR